MVWAFSLCASPQHFQADVPGLPGSGRSAEPKPEADCPAAQAESVARALAPFAVTCAKALVEERLHGLEEKGDITD